MPFLCPRCDTEVGPALYACPSCGERVTDFLRQYAQTPLDGKYHILSLLGIGGMGEVYKAIHLHLEALRVIKLMRANLVAEEGVRERFLREARLATKIQHPNVAALFDFSSLADGSWYMVWEYIDGVNLAQFVKERGKLSPSLAVRLAIQALLGFDAIHKAGIVHRDVSPENLMITRLADGSERVKIIDLGVAKQSDDAEQQTKTGVFVGKLKYASPEQLGALKKGEKIDGRADLYSFGLVLYEMLTGVAPFQAETPHHYLVMHISQAPMPFSKASPGSSIPSALEAVVLRSLEKNRENRYQSAIDFAQALSAVALPVVDSPTAVETLPSSALIQTAITPAPPGTPPPPLRTPAPELTRQRTIDSGRGTTPGARRSIDVDPALMRRRELLDQIAHALAAQQPQQADVALQTLRMHLGARAESDPDVKRSKEELDRQAAELGRWYASEIQRAKDNGAPKEVARLLDEREQKLGRKLADQAFRIEVDQWLRRRQELIDKSRVWINSESFQLAREILDDLQAHLGLGASRDGDLRLLEQSFQSALKDSNNRLLRSLAKARDTGDVEGVKKLLSWRDTKYGTRIPKEQEIADAEEWLRKKLRGVSAQASQETRSGGAGRIIGWIVAVILLGAAVAAYFWRDQLLEYLRGRSRGEAKVVLDQIAPKPQPVAPAPARPANAPPLLGKDDRDKEGRKWTSPVDGREYAWVPDTWYVIGCASGDDACRPDEKPPHTVGLKGFWIGTTEVTVEAFGKYAEAKGVAAVAAAKGEKEQGPDVAMVGTRRREGVSWKAPFKPDQAADPAWPVAMVTWDEASGYCTWIGGRLPSEAEWEAAARERDQRKVYAWGDDKTPAGKVANLADGTALSTFDPARRGDFFTKYADGFATFAPVASFPANRLGIADLSGNVWEWTVDWYAPDYYAKSPQEKVTGPDAGDARVIRGGSWASAADELRLSARRSLAPDKRSVTVGFRCAINE